MVYYETTCYVSVRFLFKYLGLCLMLTISCHLTKKEKMGVMYHFDRPGFPLPFTGLLTYTQRHESASEADLMLK